MTRHQSFKRLVRTRMAKTGEAERGRWLADAELRERGATKPRSARFDWGDGRTRVNVTFQARVRRGVP